MAEEMKKVKIKLAHPHEHQGKPCEAGETIEVWPDQAERIRAFEKTIQKQTESEG